MKAESAFLNRPESELLDELERFRLLSGFKVSIELSPKQFKIWERIIRKVKQFPDFDYAAGIDVKNETYFGSQITNAAKRKLYSKRDLLKLELE